MRKKKRKSKTGTRKRNARSGKKNVSRRSAKTAKETEQSRPAASSEIRQKQATGTVAAEQPKSSHGLPYTYNVTKVVLLKRDPYWAHAYWDLSGETYSWVDKILKNEWGAARTVLRIYDVTDVDFNGKNANNQFDLDVTIDAKNWYINLGTPDRDYLADLGVVDRNGDFHLIAQSNTIRLPRDRASDEIDEEWMTPDFDEIYALSGGLGVGLSSGEIREKIKKGISLEEILSSSAFSSGGVVKKEMKAEERDFFLQAETELILYGRTKPNAKLTINGHRIGLNSDGTFSLRLYLPDGKKTLPIKAVSHDGKDTREININVEKITK